MRAGVGMGAVPVHSAAFAGGDKAREGAGDGLLIGALVAAFQKVLGECLMV